jgi:hypothetical protein
MFKKWQSLLLDPVSLCEHSPSPPPPPSSHINHITSLCKGLYDTVHLETRALSGPFQHSAEISQQVGSHHDPGDLTEEITMAASLRFLEVQNGKALIKQLYH